MRHEDANYYRARQQINWAIYPEKLYRAQHALAYTNEKFWFVVLYGLLAIALFALTLSPWPVVVYLIGIGWLYHHLYVQKKQVKRREAPHTIPTAAVNDKEFVLMINELSHLEEGRQLYLIVPFGDCRNIRFNSRHASPARIGPLPEDRGYHSLLSVQLVGQSRIILQQGIDKETHDLLYDAIQRHAPHALNVPDEPLPPGFYIAAAAGIGIAIFTYIAALTHYAGQPLSREGIRHAFSMYYQL